MKKIVFVHLLNDFSGSPKVLSQVINNFKDKGFEIDLYTSKSKEGFLTGITANHHYFAYKRFNNRYLTLITFFFSQCILFFKLLKYKNKDVVFYINTMLPFGAGLAGKCLGKETVYHIHETSINPVLFKKFLRVIVQFSASKILYVSNALKHSERFDKKDEFVIHNALSDNFRDKTQDHGYTSTDSEGDFNVVMVCSLKAYKGVNEFVQVAKNCKETPHIKFLLILNAHENEIKNFFSDQTLPNNLKLFPVQSNLHPFYEEASLLLNLSRVDEWVETFGLTILEAMAYGVPVIVPPVGGPAEIVTHDKEGYLIDSSKTDDIALKIQYLYNNSDKCKSLSKNALQRSLDFTEENFNKNITDVIES
ncbi:MAG: glycosyltransferase family 4 protein [Bizionia sp.]|nr:glycosyltransferase family 4 protein [Bizionia sp.]